MICWVTNTGHHICYRIWTMDRVCGSWFPASGRLFNPIGETRIFITDRSSIWYVSKGYGTDTNHIVEIESSQECHEEWATWLRPHRMGWISAGTEMHKRSASLMWQQGGAVHGLLENCLEWEFSGSNSGSATGCFVSFQVIISLGSLSVLSLRRWGAGKKPFHLRPQQAAGLLTSQKRDARWESCPLMVRGGERTLSHQ